MASNDDYSWHPLHRSIQSHWTWDDKPFSKGQAWVDMILLAQFQPTKKLINGVLVPLEEGQLAWPKYLLAERWGWSRDKVERFLDALKVDHMASHQTSQRVTVITLLNYKGLRERAFNRQDTSQVAKPTTDRQLTDNRQVTSQERKEGEELKKEDHARVDGKSAKAEFWKPLCEIFGLEPRSISDEQKLYQQCLDFQAKETTPEEIQARAALYRKRSPTMVFSVKAILNNWDTLKPPPAPRVRRADDFSDVEGSDVA